MDFDFSLLPPHVITQILAYLDIDDFKNSSSVCKSWHYASTDPKIVRTLILEPTEWNFSEICKSNRKYGVLKLYKLEFNKVDSYYFELFEKFCPFVHELRIISSDLKIRHLLKLLELATSLTIFSLAECPQLEESYGLFPSDYDFSAKIRVVQNLSVVKKILIEYINNTSLVADLVRNATNLESIRFSIEFATENNFFTIFDHFNIGTIVDLKLFIGDMVYGDDFIASFLKIKNLNLRLFKATLLWNWKDGIYKSFLFRQFVLRLQNLLDLQIYGLNHDQLSIISQHLVNLKNLEFGLDNHQPISELGNLKHLEILRCAFSNDYHRLINEDEMNKFFKCKFEYLRILNFCASITESNLIQLCENHQNLIELKLTCLLTKNLEMIFKHLTKLRVLTLFFGIEKFQLADVSLIDSNREYEYKITRLQDLEVLILGELVNGISENDVQQLKKLRYFDFM